MHKSTRSKTEFPRKRQSTQLTSIPENVTIPPSPTDQMHDSNLLEFNVNMSSDLWNYTNLNTSKSPKSKLYKEKMGTSCRPTLKITPSSSTACQNTDTDDNLHADLDLNIQPCEPTSSVSNQKKKRDSVEIDFNTNTDLSNLTKLNLLKPSTSKLQRKTQKISRSPSPIDSFIMPSYENWQAGIARLKKRELKTKTTTISSFSKVPESTNIKAKLLNVDNQNELTNTFGPTPQNFDENDELNIFGYDTIMTTEPLNQLVDKSSTVENNVISKTVQDATDILGTSIKYTPVSGNDTLLVENQMPRIVPTKHHSITRMKEYKSKSFEELRFEDYENFQKNKADGFKTPEETNQLIDINTKKLIDINTTTNSNVIERPVNLAPILLQLSLIQNKVDRILIEFDNIKKKVEDLETLTVHVSRIDVTIDNLFARIATLDRNYDSLFAVSGVLKSQMSGVLTRLDNLESLNALN